MKGNCPKCYADQLCGCSNCHPRHTPEERVKEQVWGPDDTLICANCGYTASVDTWYNTQHVEWMPGGPTIEEYLNQVART